MKKTLSILLAVIMIFSAVPFVSAASTSDLDFELNEDGNSYYVSACDANAKGPLTIPSTYNGKPVTKIGEMAFMFCDRLTSVTIPDSITSIETWAFFFCEKLATIILPDSVTYIGGGAFDFTAYYDNSSNWEKGVLYIDAYLLDTTGEVSGSYTVKPGTKCIADDAFFLCEDLKSITIPESVRYIGTYAFVDCCGLASIEVSENNINYSSKDGVLFNKNQTEILCFPGGKSGSYEIPDTVTVIGEGAFEDCCDITSIIISDSVTCIGDYAFLGCEFLKSVTLGNGVTTIGEYAFGICESLKSLIIPDSVKTIGEGAFEDCEKLTLYGKTGSVAQNYAKNNGVPFKAILDGSVKVKLGTISDTSKGVSVKWTKVTGAEGYIIYRKKSTDSSFSKIATVKSGSAVSYTDATAKSGIEYTYTVKAYNAVSKSGYDKTGKTILFLSAPTTKVANKNGYINVSWNKISGAKGYVIYKKTGSGSYKKFATIKSGSTVSYKDKSVKSGTKYSYYVKAYNGSTYSGYKSGVTTMYLTAVKISSATSGKSGITVKWGKIPASKGYTVYRKTGSGKYAKLATVKGATKVSYLDKSAKKGKTYTYYVTAYNGSYRGTYANTKACKDKY